MVAAGVVATLGLVQNALASTQRATTRAATLPSNTLAGLDLNGYIGVPGAVSAVIVVPKLNCAGATAASAVAAGVGIASVNSYARLYLTCTGGVAHFYPSIVVNGTAKSFESDPAQPGDAVLLAVSQSVSKTTDSVIDLTHKFVATVDGGGGGTSQGITAGAYAVPGSAVPDFGTLAFSNAVINGFPFGATGKELQAQNLVTAGPVQIKTASSAGNKEAFSTVFVHA